MQFLSLVNQALKEIELYNEVVEQDLFSFQTQIKLNLRSERTPFRDFITATAAEYFTERTNYAEARAS
jgi:hypothetical protein